MKRIIKKILFNKITTTIYSFFCYLFTRKNRFSDFNGTISAEYNRFFSSCIVQRNRKNNHKYNLQIIVPCYNTEKYVRKCIQSLVDQKTNYKINIILIDDGSTDSTGKICDQFASHYDFVTVIHQNNKGFSQARNAGLELIDSDFLMFVDSDDYLISQTICNRLLDKAYSCNKNKLIIEFGFRRDKEGKLFGRYKPNNGVLKKSKYNGFAWGKVYSSDLFNNLSFPINYWFEDTFIKLILLFINNVNIYGLSDSSYAYRINPTSITNSYSGKLKSLDSIYILESLLKDAHELHIENTKTFRNAIMWQIVCTFIRTKELSAEIQTNIFLQTKIIINEFSGCYSLQYRFLFKSIINNKYNAYRKICNFLSKTK